MSQFLTIPLEIRQKIYRMLLLDPLSETYLSTPWEQRFDNKRGTFYDGGYQDNFFEHNYNDPDKDITKASERVWRYNPLDGIGTTNGTGHTVYSKPRLDGVMEPHVLARFKKIAFELDINWEADTLDAEGCDAEKDQTRGGKYIMQHGVAPSLFVHENMTVDPQDEADLLAFYRHSTVIHQLVKILSNSPDIVSLEISFEFAVLVRYGTSWDLDSDDDEIDEKEFRKDDAANARAMEIFMDGGFFAPLGKLSNVQSFEFQFSRYNYDGEEYKPKPRHDRMLTDLEQKIKDNYARRHQ